MSEQTDFAETLAAFETCLETPVVPGELRSWSTHAQEACNAAVAAMPDQQRAGHAALLAQIARQDPELAARVQQLRDEDVALLQQAGELKDAAGKLATDAESLPSHDPTVKKRLQEFIDSGLKWIIRARKQEVALTTWYQESFNRDTGVAD